MATPAEGLLAALGLTSFDALDLVPDPTLIVDAQERVCFLNQAMRSHPALANPVAIGADLSHALVPPIAAEVAPRLRAVLAGGSHPPAPHPGPLPRISPVAKDASPPIGAVLTFANPSSSNAARTGLRRSHILAWLETGPYLVWFKDPHGRYTLVNASFAKAVGRASAAEVLGMDDFALWPAEAAARFVEDDREVMRTREGKLIEEILPLRGQVHWFETWKSPVVDDDGAILGTLGVCRDITHRRDLEEHERRSRDQLRALAAHVESVREQERLRIAREIHDELGQSLTCMGMDLAFLDKHLDPGNKEAAARVNALGQLVKETIRCVRRISSELRPSILDDLGLCAAIEWLANDFETRTHITCRFAADEDLDLAPSLATSLFRICQEALTNVARHANATAVDIHLSREGDRARLRIRDDGVGISPEALSQHRSLGILGMHERVVMHGGTMDVRGEPGHGTVLEIGVPIGAGGAPGV